MCQKTGTVPGEQRLARILLCEDSKGVRELLATLLTEMGLEIDCTDNGEDALVMARNVLPDLIISDIVMPKMTGIELVEAIRRDPELAGVPCILMSSPDWAEEALRAKCDRFIAKPFDINHVRQSVRSLLGCHD